MSRFRFLPEALTDLEEAAAWYEDQRPGLGAALLDELDSCIVSAIESPGMGSLSGTTANTVTRSSSRVALEWAGAGGADQGHLGAVELSGRTATLSVRGETKAKEKAGPLLLVLRRGAAE